MVVTARIGFTAWSRSGFDGVYGTAIRPQARECHDAPRCRRLITISRAIVGLVGAAAVLLAGGNLLTGGASITDPVMPFGLLLGLLALGAALWTTAAERWRAVIVWLGLLAILAAFVVFVPQPRADAAIRDVLIYFGIPATIVLLATIGVAIARVRAGTLGSVPSS